jgi:hypothetical protein
MGLSNVWTIEFFISVNFFIQNTDIFKFFVCDQVTEGDRDCCGATDTNHAKTLSNFIILAQIVYIYISLRNLFGGGVGARAPSL